MLVEIRRYDIEAGRRDEFVRFFDDEVAPAMARAGIRILAAYTSCEDDTTFYYLRSFRDEAERDEQTASFYGSDVWVDDLRDRALAMETGWSVEVVIPTPGTGRA